MATSGVNKFALFSDDIPEKKVTPKTDKSEKKSTNNKTAAREQAKAKAAAPRDAQKKLGSRPPRREHDRRSGTGRGREVRKEGAGKGAYGKVKKDEVVPEQTPVVEEAPVVPAEPEVPVETLDVYEKEIAAKKVANDSKPAREVIVSPAASSATVIVSKKKGSIIPNKTYAPKKETSNANVISIDDLTSAPATDAPRNKGSSRKVTKVEFPSL